MVEVTKQWRAQGTKVLPAQVRDPLLAQYFSILASGFAVHAAQAPPLSGSSPAILPPILVAQ